MTEYADDIRARIDILTNEINTCSDMESLTRLRIERGHCYQLTDDAVNSVRDYLSALDTAVRNSDLVHIKSMIALALAKKIDGKEQAVFWAMSAVNQDTCDEEGHHTLGLVCDICGFLNLAIISLRRAIELAPDRLDSILELGRCQRNNGSIPEAIETMSRYVASSPGDPRGYFELALSLQILAGKDNLQTATEMYRRALDSNPTARLRARIERKMREIDAL